MKKRIPLIKPAVGEEELVQVKEVLESGWLASGPKVKEFERKLAEYLGAKHIVATSSCTTALVLALESISLPSGSEVIVPDFTFPATANSVMHKGHALGLVDVTLRDWSMDLAIVAKHTTKKTKALMPVYPLGHPLDIDALNESARSLDIEVIQDAATAIGAKFNGKRVGGSGRAVCFSFHPRKILTTGEGGALVTDDDDIYERALILRNHGQVSRNGHISFIYSALNYRMSDILAAVGVAQLAKLDRMIERRRKLAQVYNELLASKNLSMHLLDDDPRGYTTYQSYVMRLDGKLAAARDAIIKSMMERYMIETQVATYSMHVQPAFKAARRLGGIANGPLLYRTSLTLPLYDSLTDAEQQYIVDSLVEVARAT